MNVVSLVEGIIVGMMNDPQDFSQCVSQNEAVISYIQTAIYDFKQGFTVSNMTGSRT